jgi:hypothetical protein
MPDVAVTGLAWAERHEVVTGLRPVRRSAAPLRQLAHLCHREVGYLTDVGMGHRRRSPRVQQGRLTNDRIWD